MGRLALSQVKRVADEVRSLELEIQQSFGDSKALKLASQAKIEAAMRKCEGVFSRAMETRARLVEEMEATLRAQTLLLVVSPFVPKRLMELHVKAILFLQRAQGDRIAKLREARESSDRIDALLVKLESEILRRIVSGERAPE